MLRVTLIGLVPMGLVFIQPDIGTTIVLVAIVVGILVVAGTRAKHLAILALASIVLLFGAFQLERDQGLPVDRLARSSIQSKDTRAPTTTVTRRRSRSARAAWSGRGT